MIGLEKLFREWKQFWDTFTCVGGLICPEGRVSSLNKSNPIQSNPKHQELYRNKESATDYFGIHCKKLLKEAKIDVGEIAINSIPDVPIWNSEPVTVDFTLSEFDKSSTSSTIFKGRFNELRQKYSDFCHIYTDGSKVERKVASAYVCP